MPIGKRSSCQIRWLSRSAATTTPTYPSPHLARSRKIPLFLGAATGAAIPLYAIYIYLGYKHDAEVSATLSVPTDVRDRYGRLAETYDADVNFMEKLMGISRLRRKLCAEATGHVLETSVGTGRNMKCYPLPTGKIKTITMVDTSSEMIRVARIKWAKTNAWFINAIFRIQDAADPVPCPSPNGFDTVVQTMGICSMPDPERLLRHLGDMANSDGGRILLLEHGKSYYDWFNRVLDKLAPAHADRYGCWFNKDIGRIVESSGLEVVEAKRYHFGTTWWFVLKPPKRPPMEKVVVEKDAKPIDTEPSEMAQKPRPWWSWPWK